MPDVTDRTGQGFRGGSGPIVNAPPIVLIVIAVLIGIHAALVFAGQDWEIWSLYAFALIPARFGGSESIAMIEGSQYWSLITYAFLHDGWLHVLFNSVWLLIFGTPVARQFGTLRFLLIALVSTLGGALAMIAVFWGTPVIAVGASAAVSGLLAAAIPVMFGRRGAPLTFSEFLHNRRAIIFLLVFMGLTVLSGVQGLPGFADNARIAWEAHIGGFIAGLAAYFLVMREGMRRP
ncbi:rhomboid family intramembrane serine protease [Taklimakanibacter lacteus]|uniref:rhomboid family intramembrane serine protease n=1 Tax=Taklimakanibacter lacteus TaxID=2268456 RepID=UPI0013C441C0